MNYNNISLTGSYNSLVSNLLEISMMINYDQPLILVINQISNFRKQQLN